MTERAMNDERIAEFAGEIAKRAWPHVQQMLAESYRMGFQAGRSMDEVNSTQALAFACYDLTHEMELREMPDMDIKLENGWNVKLYRKSDKTLKEK